MGGDVTMLCMYAGCMNDALPGETDEFRMCADHAPVRDWIMRDWNFTKKSTLRELALSNGAVPHERLLEKLHLQEVTA